MIAIASEWFSGRNATGKTSSISRPSTYSGNCGPGTLVTIRLNRRVEKFSRDACARMVGGAKLCAPAITSAPSACFDSLSPFIVCVMKRRRWRGSAMYTGSGPRITTMRLPISPRSFAARTDTGTSARSSPAARDQEGAQGAGHDREHDVVDRPAEGVLDGLVVLQAVTDPVEAPV